MENVIGISINCNIAQVRGMTSEHRFTGYLSHNPLQFSKVHSQDSTDFQCYLCLFPLQVEWKDQTVVM